ncbi:MAG: hypothetical protein R6U98_06660 [Pirellulaceae bacterium]
MDPNANLEEQRKLVKKCFEAPEGLTGQEVDRLCELFDALDEWVTSGGFLPNAWDVCFRRIMDHVRA